MPAEHAVIHIDGAARGNPGPAAFAYSIVPDGEPPVEHSEVMGRATNNVAEYTALLRGLQKAVELGLKRLDVFSDSELLVKQMNGEYRVKNADLQELYSEAERLVNRFAVVNLKHVRRENNKRADELCNIALDGDKPKPASAAEPKAATAPKAPAGAVTDAAVREDALSCLRSAAKEWRNGADHLGVEHVWEQLWSILQDGGVLKKRKVR